jgi:predicted transcriptional regulator
MNKYVAFKTIMHEPMIVDGNGDINKLSEIIGDNNVERLVGLNVIKEHDGSFEVTDLGKKFVEIFNKD